MNLQLDREFHGHYNHVFSCSQMCRGVEKRFFTLHTFSIHGNISHPTAQTSDPEVINSTTNFEVEGLVII